MTIPLRPLLFKIILLPLVPSAALAEAASELDRAMERLQLTTYRKREHVDAMQAIRGATSNMVTECSGPIERLVFEIELPTIGRMRQERIKVGSRAAVRTIAPTLVGKIEEAKRKLTVGSARSLLQQLASAASALQTGGLSTASWIKEAVRAAATIKTTADARLALDRAANGFSTWQLVKDEEEEDLPDLGPSPPAAFSNDGMTVERTPGPTSETIKYVRRPAMVIPGAEFFSVVVVDARSGLPVAEENYFNGQRMTRTEYFDVGAPITIELPECLK